MQIRCAAVLAVLVLLAAGCALAEFTPAATVCGKAYCYWETPMDITDTEAVWNMLIQPMTVVEGSQKTQELLYAEPDQKSRRVGEVTCQSQGVHVLETLDNGWSLVECYSASNGNSRLRVWGDLVKGYIRTDKLVEVESRDRFGLVVDKLTQRLYVFGDGKLLTTLRVSTGAPTKWRPRYETASGEYHLVSMVGSFVDDSGLHSDYAIRFNDGDLLHAVPYRLDANGNKSYSRYEALLGTRASAGCIRVQRRATPEGINMRWLWNRLGNQQRTRLVIWEDLPGRQLSIPADDTPIYVHMSLSNYYHRSPECYQLGEKFWPFEPITYGQLEEEAYAHLTDCFCCNPPLRKKEIEAINAQYAAEAQ